tara:strand:- start:13087 stop:14988 length:1902 start_codon:yes stop_codon:yes gene_type:complete
MKWVGQHIWDLISRFRYYVYLEKTDVSTSTKALVIDHEGKIGTNSQIGTGGVTDVTGVSPVISSGGLTPAISMNAASTSVDGYLTSVDWNIFNNKTSNTGTVTSVGITETGDALTITNTPITTSGYTNIAGAGASTDYINGELNLVAFPSIPLGTVTAVTGTAPVASSGGATPDISMPVASTSADGYLSSTDWTTFNSKTTNTGTVTDVSSTTAGDALDVAVSNSTTTPEIALTWAGSSSQYIDGAGDLTTFPTIPAGDVTAVDGGTYITTTDSTGPVPVVNHDTTSRTDTTSTVSPAHGATFTSVDSVSTNATGHITALNLKTITLPADAEGVTSVSGTAPVAVTTGATPTVSMAVATTSASGYLTSTDWNTFNSKDNYVDWKLQGDSGTNQDIVKQTVVDFAGGNYMSTITTANTLTTDLSAVDGTSDTTTKFLSKDNTWDVPSYTVDTKSPVSFGMFTCSATISTSASDGVGAAVVMGFDTKSFTYSVGITTIFTIYGSAGKPSVTDSTYTISISAHTSDRYFEANWNVSSIRAIVNNRVLSGIRIQEGVLNGAGTSINWTTMDPSTSYIYDRASGNIKGGSTAGSIIFLIAANASKYYRMQFWKEKGSQAATTSESLLNGTQWTIKRLT